MAKFFEFLALIPLLQHALSSIILIISSFGNVSFITLIAFEKNFLLTFVNPNSNFENPKYYQINEKGTIKLNAYPNTKKGQLTKEQNALLRNSLGKLLEKAK